MRGTRQRSACGAFIGKVVGARLRQLRRELGLRQRTITERTGIHRPIVARIERGQHEVSFETVQRYARALGTTAPMVLLCLEPVWPVVCRMLEREAV